MEKLDSTKSLEILKAEIEKKRHEELNNVRKDYKDALDILNKSNENTVEEANKGIGNMILNFIPGTKENAKKWLESKILAGSSESDEINAKYDKELAKLG
jgi:hypothetical protein